MESDQDSQKKKKFSFLDNDNDYLLDDDDDDTDLLLDETDDDVKHDFRNISTPFNNRIDSITYEFDPPPYSLDNINDYIPERLSSNNYVSYRRHSSNGYVPLSYPNNNNNNTISPSLNPENNIVPIPFPGIINTNSNISVQRIDNPTKTLLLKEKKKSNAYDFPPEILNTVKFKKNKNNPKPHQVNNTQILNTNNFSTISPTIPNTTIQPVQLISPNNNIQDNNTSRNRSISNSYIPSSGKYIPTSSAATQVNNYNRRLSSVTSTSVQKYISPTEKKIENINFLKFQFPLFNWSKLSPKISYSIPIPFYNSNIKNHIENFNILDFEKLKFDTFSLQKNDYQLLSTFPGPLIKKNISQSYKYNNKQNDLLINWLKNNINRFTNNNISNNLNICKLTYQILLFFLEPYDSKKNNFHTLSKKFFNSEILNLQSLFSNPQRTNQNTSPILQSNSSKFVVDDQFKLLSLIQLGQKEKALKLALSKNNFIFALLISSLLGKKNWSNVIDECLEREFDSTINNDNSNFTINLLNIVFQVFIGNSRNLFENLYTNINKRKQEWYINNWNIIVAVVLINIDDINIDNNNHNENNENYNNSIPNVILEFFLEFGIFLKKFNQLLPSSILFMLARIPLSSINTLSDTDLLFDSIGNPNNILSNIWTEIYYYTFDTNIKDLFLLQIKLNYSNILFENNLFLLSHQYCNHILKELKYIPSYSSNIQIKILIAIIEDLENKISNTHNNFHNSWIFSKSSFNTVWDQLDKSFNKYIAGDTLLSSSLDPSVNNNNNLENDKEKKIFDSFSLNSNESSDLDSLTKNCRKHNIPDPFANYNDTFNSLLDKKNNHSPDHFSKFLSKNKKNVSNIILNPNENSVKITVADQIKDERNHQSTTTTNATKSTLDQCTLKLSKHTDISKLFEKEESTIDNIIDGKHNSINIYRLENIVKPSKSNRTLKGSQIYKNLPDGVQIEPLNTSFENPQYITSKNISKAVSSPSLLGNLHKLETKDDIQQRFENNDILKKQNNFQVNNKNNGNFRKGDILRISDNDEIVTGNNKEGIDAKKKNTFQNRDAISISNEPNILKVSKSLGNFGPLLQSEPINETIFGAPNRKTSEVWGNFKPINEAKKSISNGIEQYSQNDSPISKYDDVIKDNSASDTNSEYYSDTDLESPINEGKNISTSNNNNRKAKKDKKNNNAGTGWFTWFRKNKTIKAQLGRRNSFKYDDNLKRWISTDNKDFNLDTALKSIPPPPILKKKSEINTKCNEPLEQFEREYSPPEANSTRITSPEKSKIRDEIKTGKAMNLEDLITYQACLPKQKKKKSTRGYVNAFEV